MPVAPALVHDAPATALVPGFLGAGVALLLVVRLAMLASLYLMLNLPAQTWLRFFIWMALGFVVYFAYSARHSRLTTDPNYARRTPEPSET